MSLFWEIWVDLNHTAINSIEQNLEEERSIFSNNIMKDFPIFFNFTQELHLIALCLIILLVCSKVPIHLEKVNTILWRVQQQLASATGQLETTKPFFQFGNCINPHRCKIQQRCVVQRPEP